MRIDKYLASLGLVSRRDAKKFFKENIITINEEEVIDPGHMLQEWDKIQFGDETIVYKSIVVILLHKPAGYVCSDIPEWRHKSYRDLIDDCIYKESLHVAGRLDADTTGLVFVTNDGVLNHQIISPKKKMTKIYEVESEKPLSDVDCKQLQDGVMLNDGYTTLPAQVEKISDKKIILSLHEGKYHQVKRMLEAVDNKVTKLHRTQIGRCILWDLLEGKRKEIQVSDVF